MKYNKQIKFFENLQMDDHPDIPIPPRLLEDLVPDFNIFIELSANRSRDGMSGTVGTISFLEIESYCRLMKIDDFSHRQRLIKRIKIMDKVYCEHANTEKK